MDRTKTVAGIGLLALVITGCSRSGAIKVASKNFTEQVVLGEVIAQHLEHRLGRKVERQLNLGGTLLAHRALANGEIDLYPEYTGTALAAVLKETTGNDPETVRRRVQSEYMRRFRVEWLPPLGINNSFAMVVPGPLARSQHLETLTNAAAVKQPWELGVGYEFEQRADGIGALDKTYHLRWKDTPKTMDLGLLYKAMEQGQVNMIAANSTDGLLSKLDVKSLADDKHAFPPYEVCIAVRQEALADFPGLRAALEELSGKFSNPVMRQMNYEVDAEHRPVSEVAAAFLKNAGLE